MPGQQYEPETGLHYNYFRDYDPSIGRYIESDPIGLGGGLNTYGYALGNPLSYSDPTGEAVAAPLFCIGGGCQGAAVAFVNFCAYVGSAAATGFGLSVLLFGDDDNAVPSDLPVIDVTDCGVPNEPACNDDYDCDKLLEKIMEIITLMSMSTDSLMIRALMNEVNTLIDIYNIQCAHDGDDYLDPLSPSDVGLGPE